MNDLAKRLVACKGWKWMPGMASDKGIVVGVYCSILVVSGDFWKYERLPEVTGVYMHDAKPDLTDAATLGCVLQLVREAWGDPTATVFPDRRIRDEHGKPKARWFRMIDSAHHSEPVAWHCPADTEVEALVMALEAAP